MDRNQRNQLQTSGNGQSLSARRAWIEITDDVSSGGKIKVALRKESVDRNVRIMNVLNGLSRRSPQGERG